MASRVASYSISDHICARERLMTHKNHHAVTTFLPFHEADPCTSLVVMVDSNADPEVFHVRRSTNSHDTRG